MLSVTCWFAIESQNHFEGHQWPLRNTLDSLCVRGWDVFKLKNKGKSIRNVSILFWIKKKFFLVTISKLFWSKTGSATFAIQRKFFLSFVQPNKNVFGVTWTFEEKKKKGKCWPFEKKATFKFWSLFFKIITFPLLAKVIKGHHGRSKDSESRCATIFSTIRENYWEQLYYIWKPRNTADGSGIKCRSLKQILPQNILASFLEQFPILLENILTPLWL